VDLNCVSKIVVLDNIPLIIISLSELFLKIVVLFLFILILANQTYVRIIKNWNVQVWLILFSLLN